MLLRTANFAQNDKKLLNLRQKNRNITNRRSANLQNSHVWKRTLSEPRRERERAKTQARRERRGKGRPLSETYNGQISWLDFSPLALFPGLLSPPRPNPQILSAVLRGGQFNFAGYTISASDKIIRWTLCQFQQNNFSRRVKLGWKRTLEQIYNICTVLQYHTNQWAESTHPIMWNFLKTASALK